MTVVVGVDPSISATGCTVWRDGEISVHTIKSDTKEPWPVRWRQIKQGILSAAGMVMQGYRDALMVIEQPPATYVGPAAALPNHGLYAILIDWWWSFDMTYVDIQPTQLKKFATGKGNSSKEAVLLAIERTYGHLAKVRNNNESDSFALAAMGLHHYGAPLLQLPVSHIEKLDVIHWPEWRQL